jgi:glucan phosphoethanolaminetransferase (alkaline phosphatase superfamily)
MHSSDARLRNVFRNRAFIGALALSLFLYGLEEALFRMPQGFFMRTIAFMPELERQALAVGLAAAAFIGLYAFFWIALASARPVRLAALLLFAIAIGVQYGYWSTLQRFMSGIEVIIALTAAGVWTSAASLYFNWVSLVPIGALAVVMAWSWKEPRRVGLAALPVWLAVVFGVYATHRLVRLEQYPGVSIMQLVDAVSDVALSTTFAPRRAGLPEFTPAARPTNNVVVIVDESIRADHLSINGYGRATTPYLEDLARRGLLHNWGVAAAGGTCSNISNPILLTGLVPAEGNFAEAAGRPTMFHYAHALGYRTHYFDGQENFLWNGLTSEDKPVLDEWVNTRELGRDVQTDFRAADRIRGIVNTSIGNFIVLNKRGVHFLYEYSYPPEYAQWLPTPPGANYQAYPDLARNAYDNGVYYNVNTFFERLLPEEAALTDTVYVYTSDHGQTLFEDNANWLHCNFTRLEASVPMLIVGRVQPPGNLGYPASHSNILPTVLDLLGAPEALRAEVDAPSLLAPAANPAPRYFFDGALRLIPYDE